MERLSASAQLASSAATAQLIQLLDSSEVRIALRLCCNTSGVHTWPAVQLLNMLRQNVAAAEFVHNFDPGLDMTIEIGLAHAKEYFLSTWQLRFAGFMGGGWRNASAFPGSAETVAEEGIFSLPRFSLAAKDEPLTYASASSRLLYGALNMFRLDTGNPLFGNVTAVVILARGIKPTMVAKETLPLFLPPPQSGLNQAQN